MLNAFQVAAASAVEEDDGAKENELNYAEERGFLVIDSAHQDIEHLKNDECKSESANSV